MHVQTRRVAAIVRHVHLIAAIVARGVAIVVAVAAGTDAVCAHPSVTPNFVVQRTLRRVRMQHASEQIAHLRASEAAKPRRHRN